MDKLNQIIRLKWQTERKQKRIKKAIYYEEEFYQRIE